MKSIINSLAVFVTFFISLNINAQNYCIPIHQYGGFDNAIVNFAFNTLININARPDTNGYAFYPEASFTTDLNIGESYPLTASNDILAGAHGGWRAWIDYNNDGIFDNSELILVDSVSDASLYRKITIPNNKNFIGKRRLRIVSSGGLSPCDSSDYSYTADYVVNITQNTPHPLVYGMPFEPQDMVGVLYIDVFKINTLVNSQSGYDSISYSYYPDSQFTTSMEPGKSYTAYMSNPVWAGITGTYVIWIDLNNDGEFSDSEMMFTSDPCYASSATIKIPMGTTAGIHRLRVRYDWWGSSGPSGSLSPYGLGSAGETEDYDISIGHTSGLEDIIQANNQFMVYPNPVKNNLYIKTIGSDEQEVKSISVYNEVGQLIHTYLPGTSNLSSLYISYYPSGIYLLNIISQDNKKTEYKIIKE